MIRRPPRSPLSSSSAASDVYKRQSHGSATLAAEPEHPGLPGDLCFDADFECGNLDSATRISEHEFDIRIRPDTNNKRHSLWFYFRVRNTSPGQLAIFNITNFSKTRSLYREGMAPVVRSTSRPQWSRLPSRHSYYYKCPKSKRYCLSFLFGFDQEQDEYWFAYCYPYSYTQLQETLANLERKHPEFLERHLLCRCLISKSTSPMQFTAWEVSSTA
eukprot:TRINITY_DN4423_c0_g1_i3.p1 TRINITY_DN4423_c0_g1~~TRINITY_DN4423_c0_g1_i3.p1  ORF type:complete len:216 (+),score=48.11 TRINITY_DN4423_c0_g1_i3:96-743(+)